MIINFNDIVFNDQLILQGSTIQINPSEITVVTGESGSGKTSLLKSIYNDVRKKKRFYPDYSFSFQETLFIDDLTIEDHVKMIRELTESNLDTQYYLDLLQIAHTLDKYPLQLSGGEKKRVAFLLSILKNTQFILLDEPTASLNEEFTGIYMNIIHELMSRGKGFLIFTHDEELCRIADSRYHIGNHHLNVIKEAVNQNRNDHDLNKNLSSIHKILRHKDNHRKLYQKLISVFMVFSIGFICYSGGLSNATRSVQNRIFEMMDSNQITVFKPCPTYILNGEAQYSFEGYEVPFTEDELEQIRSLDHVERMEWRHDFFEPDGGLGDIIEIYKERDTIDLFKVVISENGEDLFEYSSSENFIVGTYVSDIKEKKDIEVDFGVEGVYICRAYAELITKENGYTVEDLKGKSITFDTTVPVYNTTGRVMGASDDTELMYIDSVSVQHHTFTLPIAGILKTASFGLSVYFDYAMYYERSALEEVLKDINVKGRTVYAMEPMWKDYYIDEIPADDTREPNRVIVDTPWTPKSYTLVIDSVENVAVVAQKLENMGFAAYSEGLTQSKVLAGVKKMNQVFTVVSVLFGILIIFLAAGTSFMNRKDTQKIYRYFGSIGLRKKEINRIFKEYHKADTIRKIVIVIICISAVTPFHFAFTRTIFKPSIFGIVLSLLLCLICYYLIPEFVDRLKTRR